ncbi:MAG: twin-arginine translocation signal domain-containing protein, partial [Planctomycetota bacterium]
MKKSATTRRAFLQTTAAGGVGIVLARPEILAAQAFGSIGIDEPFHGAVLNRRHGKQVVGGLKIQGSGQAPLRDRVTVNG